MASVYYDLNVSADGGLTWAASTAAPNPMPADADSFLTSLRGAFDRIRLHVPEGPLRAAYANYAFAVGRTPRTIRCGPRRRWGSHRPRWP